MNGILKFASEMWIWKDAFKHESELAFGTNIWIQMNEMNN